MVVVSMALSLFFAIVASLLPRTPSLTRSSHHGSSGGASSSWWSALLVDAAVLAAIGLAVVCSIKMGLPVYAYAALATLLSLVELPGFHEAQRTAAALTAALLTLTVISTMHAYTLSAAPLYDTLALAALVMPLVLTVRALWRQQTRLAFTVAVVAFACALLAVPITSLMAVRITSLLIVLIALGQTLPAAVWNTNSRGTPR